MHGSIDNTSGAELFGIAFCDALDAGSCWIERNDVVNRSNDFSQDRS